MNSKAEQETRFDLKLYLNTINSIGKELELNSSTQLGKNLNELDNYLNQKDCIMKSFIFNNGEAIKLEFNIKEVKHKLLFKINQLINQNIEVILAVLDSIEISLNSMSQQNEFVKNNLDIQTCGLTNLNKLYESMSRINKKCWLNFYKLKTNLKLENLIQNSNTKLIKNLVKNWLEVDLMHLEIDLEVCRQYIKNKQLYI